MTLVHLLAQLPALTLMIDEDDEEGGGDEFWRAFLELLEFEDGNWTGMGCEGTNLVNYTNDGCFEWMRLRLYLSVGDDDLTRTVKSFAQRCPSFMSFPALSTIALHFRTFPVVNF